MIKNILISLLLAMPFTTMAQCKDTTQADPYHYCGLPYQPVCGCDNVTYRNYCAAQYWGGITNLGALYDGLCPNLNFDFDFAPNPIFGNSGGSSDSHLHIYINQSLFSNSTTVSYSVYLLDIFNKVMYQRDATARPEDNITSGNSGDYGVAIGDFSSNFFAQFENGVYLLIVTVNGEQKSKKILIENPK